MNGENCPNRNVGAGLKITPAAHGNLESWAKQGVLLLNASLSVRAKPAKSSKIHLNIWEKLFTPSIIERLSQNKENLVFMLWGRVAQKKSSFIAPNKNHLILEAPHPSPLSAHKGFIGCGHFSKTNQFLQEHGLEPVCWELPPQK